MKVVAFLQVAVLLTAIVTLNADAQDCELGWFGEQCLQKCHCQEDKFCQSNGYCSNGKCEDAYFGPACQFLDMAAKFKTIDTPTYLVDHDDATCNTDESSTSVYIEILRESQFLWFRMDYIGKHDFLNFTISLNDGLACVNGRKFKNSEYVDVMCENDVILKRLNINGSFAGSVCSIKISQGRNLSVKQRTCQSSIYDNGNQCCGPSKAVDGTMENDCSITKSEDNPHLQILFQQPSLILFVFIRTPSGEAELENFRLLGFSDTNETSFRFNSPANIRRYKFDVWIYSRNLTKHMLIELPGKNRQINICEIEAFGENSCPKGTYGLECSERCQCNNRSICNHITGVCSEACNIGFYGFNCEFECAENCMHRTCHQATGHCDQCIPGYIGHFCNTECSLGFWGSECKQTCSKHCSEPCNYISGSCNCFKHFTGVNCSECSPGLWGPHCNQRCSELCAEPCNQVTGICQCIGRFAGKNCSGCSHGFWSTLCNRKCSKHCAGPCNHKTGSCKCAGHFTGSNCSVCSNGYYKKDCSGRCPKFCKTCDRKNGKCLSCLPNRVGKICEDCVSGKWGLQCRHDCSSHCSGKCNPKNGYCKCSDHFTGQRCSDCTSGYYGDECTNICPKFCMGRICHRQSGECVACLGTRVGILCEECQPKMYGVNCDLNCSKYCVNGTCDQLTGKCSKCIKGFSGESCLFMAIKPSAWVAPFTAIPFFLLILLCIPDCPIEDTTDSESSSTDEPAKESIIDNIIIEDVEKV